VLGNGKSIRFLEDNWLGDTRLAKRYPSLFNIVQRKNVMVANVLGMMSLNIEFRRTLTGNKWNRWLHLVQRLMHITLLLECDRFVWKLTTFRKFYG
jgi:hypothetical protein